MIYLDESGFEPEYPTLLAWAPRGKVVYGERSSQRRPRQNLLAARNSQEFLAPMIVSGNVSSTLEHCWWKGFQFFGSQV
ncbi:MAG: transposase [Cyanobacteria bacterium P01_D01_bin.115]